MQFADIPFRQGDDAHAGKAHALIKASDIFLIARKPIEGFRQDEIEAAALRIGDQLLNAGAKQRSTRNGAIDITICDRPTLPFGIQTAEPQLVLDRRVTLVIAAVAGIKSDPPQNMKPARQREMVDHVRAVWRVSIRRACRALPVERSSYHY